MPLQDHFHPPLSARRHWHAFHNSWATYLSSEVNARLPEGYFAEANVQFGIEIDVASFEEPATWAPPAAQLSIPITRASDTVEVLIYHNEGGPTLAGAIELVSPANKDRPAHRDAFTAKCVTYIHQGVGLVVVDAVTERKADLHGELLARFGSANRSSAADLYTAAYRPVLRDERTNLDIWHETLSLGQPLPTMPLWLRGDICVPVELEAAYERTCREQRVLGNGM